MSGMLSVMYCRSSMIILFSIGITSRFEMNEFIMYTNLLAYLIYDGKENNVPGLFLLTSIIQA